MTQYPMLSKDEQASILRHARGMAVAKNRAVKSLRMGMISQEFARKKIRHAETKFRDLLKEVG